jgi:hypothetical protein
LGLGGGEAGYPFVAGAYALGGEAEAEAIGEVADGGAGAAEEVGEAV